MTPVEVAKGYLGTHNGLPFLKVVGIHFKASWCAAFAVFCTVTAIPNSHIPRTASCYQLWTRSGANPTRFVRCTPDKRSWGICKPQPGDLVVFKHGTATASWLGHAGIVEEVLPDGRLRTIEGNTSPNAGGDQREGNTVAEKTRVAGVRGFWMMGTIHERVP